MEIMVINLDEDKERLQRTTQRLSALGLSWERLPAIHWRNLTEEHHALVNRERQEAQGIMVFPGEIGCWMSHRLAHQKVAKGPGEMGLIMEDDIEIQEDLPEVLEQIERGEIGSFDIIRLHRFRTHRPYVPVRQIGKERSLGFVRPADLGTQAYVITRRAAQTLMKKVPRMVRSADHQLTQHHIHGLIPLSIDPPVVLHKDGGHSSITTSSTKPRPANLSQFMRRKFYQLCRKYHYQADFYKMLKLTKANFENSKDS